MADVIGETETVVVDPDGQALVGEIRQALAEARHQMQPRCDRGADAVDVDAALGRAHRRRIEQHHAADVHVAARVLEPDEGGVLRAQAFVK